MFKKGIKDGIPIALGYLSVSFTFGMMARNAGIPIEVAFLISLTNLTSAGQFAALDILLLQNAYIEMALTQLIINLRYALMSLSLSQKINSKINTKDRMIMSFSITDEIYALAMIQKGKVNKAYWMGISLLPIIAWALGTLIGASACDLLPLSISNNLQIAIYGMFLAIIIPPAKQMKSILIVIIIASIMSCLFTILNTYISIGSGFVIIICSLVSASIGAILFPVKEANHD